MKLRCNRRALVDDAGGEQNGKCLHRAVGRVDGEASVIACAGDQRCTAVSGVNDPNREVEAGEVDCCGKARRTGADDKAVKRR